MKRALLIAGGTVGGLGAVLSITPPQLGSQGMTNLAGSVNGAGSSSISTVNSKSAAEVVPQATSNVVKASASSASTSATPKASGKKSTKVAAKKSTVTTPKKTTPTKTTTSSSTHATVSTPAATMNGMSTAKKVNGTFAGSTVFVNYGNVQVEITVVDGKITDARALQAPTGRSDRFTQYAVPVLRQQTLAAQSAKIQGASGASYTSYGWYTSLQVALSKAGM
ncbi:MAG: hypothetical protein HY050_06690 [Actinobacteria bacterium]|nr:hypothetical protein [Actinomycetota bacterium]